METMLTVMYALTWLLCLVPLIGFNYRKQFDIPAIILSAGAVIIRLTAVPYRQEWMLACGLFLTLVLISSALINLMVRKFSHIVLFSAVSSVCALGNLLTRSVEVHTGVNALPTGWLIPAIIGYIVVGVVGLFFMAMDINPDPLAIILQKGIGNYPADPKEWQEERNGIHIFHDVTYESTLPNNTYDVYVVPDSKGVFVFFHGGGFVMGDKDRDQQRAYLEAIMQGGYSVVSVDYVLAPQNPLPQCLIQANEALAYFIRHAGDYGLSNENIIVSGDSAGGTITGLIGCIETNPEYARKLGVISATEGTGVKYKALVIQSGYVYPEKRIKSGSLIWDWMLDVLARSGSQNNDHLDSDLARLCSSGTNCTEDYPPIYISDGNIGTFTNMSKAFAEKLKKLGVEVESNFPDIRDVKLHHIWELDMSLPVSQENMKRTIAFMDAHVN